MASAAPALRLSVLCDDTAASDEYLTELGASILIELPKGHRWLMDTGRERYGGQVVLPTRAGRVIEY